MCFIPAFQAVFDKELLPHINFLGWNTPAELLLSISDKMYKFIQKIYHNFVISSIIVIETEKLILEAWEAIYITRWVFTVKLQYDTQPWLKVHFLLLITHCTQIRIEW